MMFLCAVAGNLARLEPIHKRAPAVFDALAKLFPNGHHVALWHPGALESGSAMVALVAIGLAFFALGFWRFSARDA